MVVVIAKKRISPHELRHSCTELYVQAGASLEDIRRLLNQSCVSVTQRYIHRTDERLSAIAARVGEGGREWLPERAALRVVPST